MGAITQNKFLTDVGAIERKAAELYAEFAARFSHQPEIKAFFSTLSDEEYDHERAIMLLTRIIRGFDGKLEINPKFNQISTSLIENLDKAIEMMRSGKAISLVSALTISLRIETSMIEELDTDLIDTDSAELLKTFKMLNHHTGEHKKRITDLLEKVESL